MAISEDGLALRKTKKLTKNVCFVYDADLVHKKTENLKKMVKRLLELVEKMLFSSESEENPQASEKLT